MSGGTILRADVAMGNDGRSRGFGMVTFASEADAERARSMFNGCVLSPRMLSTSSITLFNTLTHGIDADTNTTDAH